MEIAYVVAVFLLVLVIALSWSLPKKIRASQARDEAIRGRITEVQKRVLGLSQEFQRRAYIARFLSGARTVVEGDIQGTILPTLAGCYTMLETAKRHNRRRQETESIVRHVESVVNMTEVVFRSIRDSITTSRREQHEVAGALLSVANGFRDEIHSRVTHWREIGLDYGEQEAKISKLKNAFRAGESTVESDPATALKTLALQYGIMLEILRATSLPESSTKDGPGGSYLV